MSLPSRATPAGQAWDSGTAGKGYAIAAAIVAAWLIFMIGGMTAHVFSATRFILYDQGSYLYAVGQWQSGQSLYRDFAWQYGPLALAWYRGFAAIGGNTPLTLVVASSIPFALAWMLMARLLVRAAGWGWGGGLAIVGLLPVMSPSGPTAINGPHGAIEMLLLAAGAWVLAAPRQRSWRPWLLGVLAGLLQWVRFGPHAGFLAAAFIILAVEGWTHRTDNRAWLRQLASGTGRMVLGYFALVVPLAIWYFLSLPAAGAREQLWPAYMIAHYAATYHDRWPDLPSAGDFLLVWLPALAGVGFALTRLGRGMAPADTARNPGSDASPGLIFLPLYYALGCVLLFHNAYAITGQMWLAWPGLGLAAFLARPWMRALAALLSVPVLAGGVMGTSRMIAEERQWAAQPLTLPNGQQLWFRAFEAQAFGRLGSALAQRGQPRPRLAVLLGGGGVHHFFVQQRVGRIWWYLPEFVRPWEEAQVEAALLHSERILVVDMGQGAGTTDARTVALWLPLPRPMAERLLPHLHSPRRLDWVGDLLDVVP